MPRGICKLCLQKKELQDSHLIGRAVYRLFRKDEGEDPIVMMPDVVLQTWLQSAPSYRATRCWDEHAHASAVASLGYRTLNLSIPRWQRLTRAHVSI